MKTFKGIVMAAPQILGEDCDSVSKDDGIHYSWRRGPMQVEIEPSVDQHGRKDWRVSIWFFAGNRDNDHNTPVLVAWRSTIGRASAYADRKLQQVERALLAPRPEKRRAKR